MIVREKQCLHKIISVFTDISEHFIAQIRIILTGCTVFYFDPYFKTTTFRKSTTSNPTLAASTAAFTTGKCNTIFFYLIKKKKLHKPNSTFWNLIYYIVSIFVLTKLNEQYLLVAKLFRQKLHDIWLFFTSWSPGLFEDILRADDYKIFKPLQKITTASKFRIHPHLSIKDQYLLCGRCYYCKTSFT